MRELREVDAFGARHDFVGADDGEGEDVEFPAAFLVREAANDGGERLRRRQLRLDRRLEPDFAGALQDEGAFLLGQLAVGARRGDRQADDSQQRIGQRLRQHR